MGRHSRLGVAGRTYQPTPEQRRQVMALIGYGITRVEIATLLEVDIKTLRKHFHRELDTGAIEANARVAQALYTNATKNMHVGAQIWWTKTRMGWKEAQDVNITGDQKMAIEFSWADEPPHQPAIASPPVIEANAEPGADDDGVTVTFEE